MQDWHNPYAAILEQWANALNSGDIPALLSLYADHAMLVPTMVGTFLETQIERAAYFQTLLVQQIKVRFTDGLPHEMIIGDMVILSGDYEFISADMTVHARYSFTLQPKDNGWQIIHHHSSQTPEKILLVDKNMMSFT